MGLGCYFLGRNCIPCPIFRENNQTQARVSGGYMCMRRRQGVGLFLRVNSIQQSDISYIYNAKDSEIGNSIISDQ